jgi:hypothetical protein
MGRRIASESKQTVRGGPKPAKVGLHRRLGRTGLWQENMILIFCRANNKQVIGGSSKFGKISKHHSYLQI